MTKGMVYHCQCRNARVPKSVLYAETEAGTAAPKLLQSYQALLRGAKDQIIFSAWFHHIQHGQISLSSSAPCFIFHCTSALESWSEVKWMVPSHGCAVGKL